MQNGAANGAAPAAKPSKQGAIEKMYQKKSQLEHILLRPDTYIGSVERISESMWVAEKKEEEGNVSYRMVQRDISYVPGLYKIFDEILVNAAGEFGMVSGGIAGNARENTSWEFLRKLAGNLQKFSRKLAGNFEEFWSNFSLIPSFSR
jgi:hypothetical protein